MLTVSFVTLGCKVNQYETEMMKEQFADHDYQVLPDGEGADVVVINTCSVTNLSDRKSRQSIRRMQRKKPDSLVVVTGCYAQTDADSLARMDGVCIIAGTNVKSRIVEYVEDYLLKHGTERGEKDIYVLDREELKTYEDAGMIRDMDARTRVFIKVEEGCDRFCSYCIIPYARGSVRSRALADVVAEVKRLVEEGYKEIVLTGINTALYGSDFPEAETGGKTGIECLLDALDRLQGDFRIRLSSLEPNVIQQDVIMRLRQYKKLCPHMHLSLQSGSDSVLKRMNRRYSAREYMDLVRELRSMDPCYAVTTDIIVGFPGETEEEFADSLRMVQEAGFSRVHAFKYSRRNGTAAARMQDQIDGTVKQTRSEELIRCADRQTEAFFLANREQVRRVLFEKMDPDGWMEGYTDNYIRVYLRPDEEEEKYLGEFADVCLKDLFRDGMRGEIVDPV